MARGHAQDLRRRLALDRPLDRRRRQRLRPLLRHPHPELRRRRGRVREHRQRRAGDHQPGGHLPRRSRPDDLLLGLRGPHRIAFPGCPPAPYDESVPDPYDYYSPLHRWTFRFSQAEIDAKLGAYVDGRLRRIQVTQRGQSGRIDYARLLGTGGATTIRGDSLELALGLYDRLAFFKKVTG